jgi:hypothetical protein
MFILTRPSAVKSKPLTGDSLSDVEGFQSASPTPSASSAIVSVTAAALVPSGTASSTNPQLPASTSTTSSALATGAIAGIAIAAVAFLAAIVFALWFFLVKKKRKTSTQHGTPYEVHGTSTAIEKYAYQASELASPPAELAGKKRETVENRHEMDSSSTTEEDRVRRGR